MCEHIQDHQLSLRLHQLVPLLADDGAEVTGAGLCVGCRGERESEGGQVGQGVTTLQNGGAPASCSSGGWCGDEGFVGGPERDGEMMMR